MNKDLETIKKKYGENMAHLCRELFPNILAQEGRLPELLQDNFAVSKNLATDIKKNNYTNSFQSFLLNRANIEINKSETNESPDILLDKAGYNFYECTTQAEINRFKKYYKENEQICTFNDPSRLMRNYVFFAVKKNVDEIKRENFTNPNREDEYGTSVISIQFTRGKSNVTSIKNRYNDAVDNPDFTFSNDLENIIPGLTRSFEKQYNLHIGAYGKTFYLDNYEQANDNRFYKCNHHINDIYYCENNIILDKNNVIRDYQMPERYIFMDNYILDISKKKVILYNDDNKDGFIDNLQNIEKVDILKDKKEGLKTLIIKKTNEEDVEIVLNKNNNIVKYKNHSLVDAGDNFLRYSKNLEILDIPNMRKAGKNLLCHNKRLKEFNQPLLEEVPDGCLEYNEILDKVNIDNAKKIGDNFLNSNKELLELNADNAEVIGRGLLEWNKKIENVNIKNARFIDSYFVSLSKDVKINGSREKLELNTEKIADGFLSNQSYFKEIKLPKLKEVGAGFLSANKIVNKLETPELENIGSSFLTSAEELRKVDLPKTIEIGDDFLSNNKKLESINVNNVRVVGNRFLKENLELKKINLDNLEQFGYEFIPNNRKIKIQAKNLSLKEKFYTNHIRKIKKTFEIIKKITIYNKKSLNNNQELVRGDYNGQMMFRNDQLNDMFNDNNIDNDRGRWR